MSAAAGGAALDAEALRLARVRPADWPEPPLRAEYDLVVIGAGAAGLIASSFAAGLGARTLLIEREQLGGDCLNTGCVPSKALLHAAREVATARRAAARWGCAADERAPDFARVMQRLRAVRARISAEDSALRFRDELGVEVRFGTARFRGPRQIALGAGTLRFRRAIVATGSQPALPALEGLAQAGFHTNETIFDLDVLPPRLAVVGGGPVGCELAQAFARLGSRVVLLEAGPRLLPRDDAEASELIASILAREGVRVVTGAVLERALRQGELRVVEGRDAGGSALRIEAEALLVACGRRPRVADLGLEAAGVDSDPMLGIRVDDFLRTRNRRIFAAGDVCLAQRFTHAADASAKLAVINALLWPSRRYSRLVVPACTYTDPEIARIGAGADELAERGIACDEIRLPLTSLNRFELEDETEGFARLWVERGKDRILGATLVAPQAGELIAPLALALQHGLGLRAFVETLLPYPTRSELWKRAAGQWMRGRFSPRLARALGLWIRLRR